MVPGRSSLPRQSGVNRKFSRPAALFEESATPTFSLVNWFQAGRTT
jgi:hypothetical protein